LTTAGTVTINVTKNLDSHLPQVNSVWLQSVNITSLSGTRSCSLGGDWLSRAVDRSHHRPQPLLPNPDSYPSRLFRSSIPSFQISEPVFFFSMEFFQTWFGKFKRPRFLSSLLLLSESPLLSSTFRFLGQEKNRSPTITRKYRNPFLQLAPIRTPEENASSTRLLSSECTAIAAENTSGNGSGPTTQYRFMACHSCRGKRRSSSSKLGSEWKPLYFCGPLALRKGSKLSQQRVCESRGSGSG
jgi:hypothetical protein